MVAITDKPVFYPSYFAIYDDGPITLLDKNEE